MKKTTLFPGCSVVRFDLCFQMIAKLVFTLWLILFGLCALFRFPVRLAVNLVKSFSEGGLQDSATV